MKNLEEANTLIPIINQRFRTKNILIDHLFVSKKHINNLLFSLNENYKLNEYEEFIQDTVNEAMAKENDIMRLFMNSPLNLNTLQEIGSIFNQLVNRLSTANEVLEDKIEFLQQRIED